MAGAVLLGAGTFTIHERERVGLVGRNGSGKSTLMEVLADAELPTSGTITRRRELTVSYLPQETRLVPHKTVRENILDGAAAVMALLKRYESTAIGSREHTALEAALSACEGWSVPQRLAEISTWLRAPPLERRADTLSGGELRRVGLCRALISRPDLLLLDEPTNHLDTEAIEWLEEHLLRSAGTVAFVTHDRAFLDRIATRILELDRGEIYRYDGSYTTYLRGKAVREEDSVQREAKRQQFLRREIDWVRRGPKARGTKARSRLQRFEDASAQAVYERDEDVEIIMPPAGRLSGRVLELHDVGLKLGGEWLFRGLNLELTPGQKLGVIGPNGVGKTSLLRLLLGELTPSEGKLLVGARTRLNYIDQHRELLEDANTVFDEVGEGKDVVQLGPVRINLWSYLKRYLFSDEEIRTLVGELSGGERNRVLLAKMLKRGGNVVMLDEPTNDLDFSTLRVLEEALSTFSGCVLVVSHDRYFLNRMCTAILAFEAGGRVVLQEGDYDYYVAKRRQRADAVTRSEPERAKQEWKQPPAVRKLKWKEERELERMEGDILDAEAEVQRLEATFSAPDFFDRHGARTAALTTQLQQARSRVSRLYERWEELESIKSEAGADATGG